MIGLLLKHKVLMAGLVAGLVLALPLAAFAQTATPGLEIDTGAMTAGLFQGANIIIAALGTVMFLLAGFKLGGVLIRGIVDAIGGIRF